VVRPPPGWQPHVRRRHRTGRGGPCASTGLSRFGPPRPDGRAPHQAAAGTPALTWWPSRRPTARTSHGTAENPSANSTSGTPLDSPHTDHGPFQDIAHLASSRQLNCGPCHGISSGLYRRFPTLNAHGPNKAALPADRRSRRLRAIERPLLSWASTSFPGIQRPAYQIRQCPLSGADVDLLSVQEGRTADRPLFG